jgi:membrane protein
VLLVSGLRDKPWVRTALDSWERLRVTNGNLYAAAITYFSLLALFPLLLLAVSIAGFVLHANPETLQKLFDKLSTQAPGAVGSTLHDSIQAAINARTSLGILGLIGVLFTGLGWIGNLRAAMDAIWERQPPKENPVKQRLINLLILAALGLGALVSLGLTALWSALSHDVLGWLGLDNVPGMGTLLGFAGIVVTLVADSVIFFLLLTRLPRADVPSRTGLRGAVLAALGFEILKIAGTYTIAATAGSPTAGPFAGLLAVLIWLQLVARWTLFCAAWTAERTLRRPAAPAPALPPVADTAPVEPAAALSPATVGVGLVGAGAVAGAVVTAYVMRRNTD